MGPIGCTETSVRNYHRPLRNSGNSLPTFRDNRSGRVFKDKESKTPLKMGPIGCTETSVRNDHRSLRNKDNSLPTFRDNLSGRVFKDKESKIPLKMGPIGCTETSLRNYHRSLRNNPEESSSTSRRKPEITRVIPARVARLFG